MPIKMDKNLDLVQKHTYEEPMNKNKNCSTSLVTSTMHIMIMTTIYFQGWNGKRMAEMTNTPAADNWEARRTPTDTGCVKSYNYFGK